jgi:hypothetical protein
MIEPIFANTLSISSTLPVFPSVKYSGPLREFTFDKKTPNAVIEFKNSDCLNECIRLFNYALDDKNKKIYPSTEQQFFIGKVLPEIIMKDSPNINKIMEAFGFDINTMFVWEDKNPMYF